MELSKQVVSLELARKLKTLGVKQESVWAWYEATDRDDTPRLNRFDEHCTVCVLPKQQWEENYAAFTVAELGEMLPMHHNYGAPQSGKCNGGDEYVANYIHWGNLWHDHAEGGVSELWICYPLTDAETSQAE
jgi:hypothetical protein